MDMRRWLAEVPNNEYDKYYIRLDYLANGSEDEKKEKMERFKIKLIEYFVYKHLPPESLIDESAACSLDNIQSDCRALVQEIFDSLWERDNKINNLKGLLGETICTWLCETFDEKPIMFSPLKRLSSTEQGLDRWELRNSGDRIILRIWSAKCTENKPSSVAAKIRDHDFSRIQVSGLLSQIEDMIKQGKTSFMELDMLKSIFRNMLKPESQLSFGVLIAFDYQTYTQMYGSKKGQKLSYFTQPFSEYAEKIIRFLPIDGFENYIESFENNTGKLLRGELRG